MPKPFRFRIYDKLPRWIYWVVTVSLNLAVGSYKHLSNPFSQIQGTSIHGRDGDRWGGAGLGEDLEQTNISRHLGKGKSSSSHSNNALSGGYVGCLEGILKLLSNNFNDSREAIRPYLGWIRGFLVRSAIKPRWFKVTQIYAEIDDFLERKLGLHNENLLWLWFLLYTFSRNGQPSRVPQYDLWKMWEQNMCSDEFAINLLITEMSHLHQSSWCMLRMVFSGVVSTCFFHFFLSQAIIWIIWHMRGLTGRNAPLFKGVLL